MRIDHFDIYRLQLPFRLSFKHSTAARKTSDSILVRCVLKDGTAGFGESLPRPYVTGETVASVIEDLRQFCSPQLSGEQATSLADFDPVDFREVEDLCRTLYPDLKSLFPQTGRTIGASVCALELALLDAYGKHFDTPCFLGKNSPVPVGEQIEPNAPTRASLVIGSSSKPLAAAMGLLARAMDFGAIKVKVGTPRADGNLDTIRRLVPNSTEIRVDANGVWNWQQALDWIQSPRGHNLVGIEQPLAADDFDGLKRLTEETETAIMLDESLRDMDDAERLAGIGGNLLLNIRISKCGGLYHSLRIAHYALAQGLGIQLGCQVGESSILSSAQLRLLSALGGVRFLEGCYGTYLLKDDLVAQPLRFHRGGRLPECPKGAGFGLEIDEEKLSCYAQHAARVTY